jgi:hypothetical protein
MRRAPEDEVPSDETLAHSPATRTGIEELDKVVEAILSNQVDARREFVHFTEVGCTNADGLGGPLFMLYFAWIPWNYEMINVIIA